MQENDEKRIERTVVWLDAKLVPRMDGWLAADNCKNRSEFINKALRFYMGYLGTEDNTAYQTVTAEVTETRDSFRPVITAIRPIPFTVFIYFAE